MNALTEPITVTRTKKVNGQAVIQWAAIGYLVALTLLALAFPLLGWDSYTQDIAHRLLPPGSPGHLLGTDEFGRDVLARLVDGARVELLIACSAALIGLVVGSAIGMIGAYVGSWGEFVTMRLITDSLVSFPAIVLALLVVTIYGSSTPTIIAVVSIVFIPTFARLAYGQALSVRRREYVEAAQLSGARTPTMLARVIFPNIVAPLIAQATVVMALAILLESGLTYLGLGVAAPAPSWGGMIASGQRFMLQNPWGVLIPSIVIVLTIMAFATLGDALRDRLDPRRKRRRDDD